MVELRGYQIKLTNDIYSSWNAGNRNVLAVLPTGGGKSPIVGGIVKNHSGASVTIAHRQELVSQMSIHLARNQIVHRIIAPRNIIANITKEHRNEFGRSFINPNSMASVAGVDTLISRIDELKDWANQVTFWTIDEAHHTIIENKWGKTVALFPRAYGLGVTATPSRTDGKGLGIHADGVFHDMVIGPSTRDLIRMGYLTDYEIVIPESDFDIESLTITPSGDYSPKKMREASRKSKIIGDVVENYIKWSANKLAIVFATDVETAKEMEQKFNFAGVNAASLDAKATDYERYTTIKKFKERQIKVLINVDLFGEGFDVPAVETIVMARPTKSLGLFLQMIGRGLRLMEGKEKALIIDHVSNVREFGLPDRPRKWTLDRRDKRKRKERDPNDIPVTSCPNCFKTFERIYRCCPYCGFEPPILPGGRSSPEMVDGDLLLLDSATLERMRQSVIIESPASVAERVSSAAGPIAGKRAFNNQKERLETQQQLRDAIALWAGYGRYYGKADSELHRRFYHWFGYDVLTALTLPKNEMLDLIGELTNECNSYS